MGVYLVLLLALGLVLQASGDNTENGDFNCLNVFDHEEDKGFFCEDYPDDEETYEKYVELMDKETKKGKEKGMTFVESWLYSLERMESGEFATDVHNLTDYESLALYTINVERAFKSNLLTDAKGFRNLVHDFYHFEPLNFFLRRALDKLKSIQGHKEMILFSSVKASSFESCEVGEITFFDAFNFATVKDVKAEKKAGKVSGINGTVFLVNSTSAVNIKGFFGHPDWIYMFTSCPRFEVTRIEPDPPLHYVYLAEVAAADQLHMGLVGLVLPILLHLFIFNE